MPATHVSSRRPVGDVGFAITLPAVNLPTTTPPPGAVIVRWGKKRYALSVIKIDKKSGEEKRIAVSQDELRKLAEKVELSLIFMSTPEFQPQSAAVIDFIWEENKEKSLRFKGAAFVVKGDPAHIKHPVVLAENIHPRVHVWLSDAAFILEKIKQL